MHLIEVNAPHMIEHPKTFPRDSIRFAADAELSGPHPNSLQLATHARTHIAHACVQARTKMKELWL